MDLTDAIKHLQVSAGEETVEEVDGIKYRIKPKWMDATMIIPPSPAPLNVATLTGMVNYLIEKPGLFVYIKSHDEVRIVSDLHPTYMTRETHMVAEAGCAGFYFGKYLQPDVFIIGLKSAFEIDYGELKRLITFVSSMKSEHSKLVEDDGVKQAVTVQKGITTMDVEEVPNIVTLNRFVTFPEIMQPGREYHFRIRDNGDGPECALFEVGDPSWQVGCIRNIRSFFEKSVEGVKVIS